MEEEHIREILLAKALEVRDSLVVSFTGRRFYNLDQVVSHVEDDAVIVECVFTPVEYFGSYPVTPEGDTKYELWLLDTKQFDPLYVGPTESDYTMMHDSIYGQARTDVWVEVLDRDQKRVRFCELSDTTTCPSGP